MSLTLVCVFLFLSLFTLFLIFWCFDFALLLALSYFLIRIFKFLLHFCISLFALCVIQWQIFATYVSILYYGCLFLRIPIKIHVFQDFSLIL
jgi:hypothetical protein